MKENREHKTTYALFANAQKPVFKRAEFDALGLTMTTQQGKSEIYFATTVTRVLGDSKKTFLDSSQQSSTSRNMPVDS